MNTFILLIIFLAGSLINIPLFIKSTIKAEKPSFFSLNKRIVSERRGVSINVAGGVVPVLASVIIAPWHLRESFLILLAISVFFSFMGSRLIDSKGVLVAVFLPAFFTSLFSVLLLSNHAPEGAFAAGCLGVFVGADIINMPLILTKKKGVAVIGGKGILDAIFLTGVLAALGASLLL